MTVSLSSAQNLQTAILGGMCTADNIRKLDIKQRNLMKIVFQALNETQGTINLRYSEDHARYCERLQQYAGLGLNQAVMTTALDELGQALIEANTQPKVSIVDKIINTVKLFFCSQASIDELEYLRSAEMRNPNRQTIPLDSQTASGKMTYITNRRKDISNQIHSANNKKLITARQTALNEMLDDAGISERGELTRKMVQECLFPSSTAHQENLLSLAALNDFIRYSSNLRAVYYPQYNSDLIQKIQLLAITFASTDLPTGSAKQTDLNQLIANRNRYFSPTEPVPVPAPAPEQTLEQKREKALIDCGITPKERAVLFPNGAPSNLDHFNEANFQTAARFLGEFPTIQQWAYDTLDNLSSEEVDRQKAEALLSLNESNPTSKSKMEKLIATGYFN